MEIGRIYNLQFTIYNKFSKVKFDSIQYTKYLIQNTKRGCYGA
jgi:hypothetical protein